MLLKSSCLLAKTLLFWSLPDDYIEWVGISFQKSLTACVCNHRIFSTPHMVTPFALANRYDHLQASKHSYDVLKVRRNVFRGHWSRNVDFGKLLFWRLQQGYHWDIEHLNTDIVTSVASKNFLRTFRTSWLFGSLQMIISIHRRKRSSHAKRRNNSMVANVNYSSFLKIHTNLLKVVTET